jgi:hypothetical protein
MKNNKSVAARAATIGLSEGTLRAEINEGRGPVITRPSPRRAIIEDEAWEVWLEERRERVGAPVPAESDRLPPRPKSPNPATREKTHAAPA